MRMALRLVVLSVAILGAVPAMAQDNPAPAAAEPDSTIVVTGKTEPPTRREVFEQALEVSRVDPGNMYEEALASVTAPLCPSVVGDYIAHRDRTHISQSYAGYLTDELEEQIHLDPAYPGPSGSPSPSPSTGTVAATGSGAS